MASSFNFNDLFKDNNSDNGIGIEYRNGDMYDGNGNFTGNEATGSNTSAFNDIFANIINNNNNSEYANDMEGEGAQKDASSDSNFIDSLPDVYKAPSGDNIYNFGSQIVSGDKNSSSILNLLNNQYSQNTQFNQEKFDYAKQMDAKRFDLTQQQMQFNQSMAQQQLDSLNNFRQSQLALAQQQLASQNEYNSQMLDIQKQREQDATALGNRRLDLLQQQNNRMYGIAKERNDKLNQLTDKQMSLIEQQVSALKQQLEANQWAFQVRKEEYNRISNLRNRLTSSYMS